MNRADLKNLIENLESQKKGHDQKFARDPDHAHCVSRFEAIIARLRKELAVGAEDEGASISGRGDELKLIDELNRFANALEAQNKKNLAAELKTEARSMLAHQLDDLDGFDR
ncbi:MAG TPA: hypothetical protein V6D17_00605 [Candidatus Obscuribacterales bacterium]